MSGNGGEDTMRWRYRPQEISAIDEDSSSLEGLLRMLAFK